MVMVAVLVVAPVRIAYRQYYKSEVQVYVLQVDVDVDA